MDSLEVRQLVVGDVNGNGEEETGVAAVDQLVVVVFDEICELLVPGSERSEQGREGLLVIDDRSVKRAKRVQGRFEMR